MHVALEESLVPLLHVHKAFSLYMGLQVEHILKHSFLIASHIIDMLYPGFLLRILWSSQSGHHSQNSLAKLGYILNMKVGKKKIFLFAWISIATYS